MAARSGSRAGGNVTVQAHFGAEPFALAAGPDFGGPERFADGLSSRFLQRGAMVPSAERVFTEERSDISINPQINVRLAIEAGASAPAAVERATLELHRERSLREIVHIVEGDPARPPAETPRQLHARLSERFERIEREVRSAPAPAKPDRAGAPAASGDATTPPAPAAAMVFHRLPAQPPQPPALEIRRELPKGLQAASGNQLISSKEIGRVADEVISVLNRQSLAWRERFGRR